MEFENKQKSLDYILKRLEYLSNTELENLQETITDKITENKEKETYEYKGKLKEIIKEILEKYHSILIYDEDGDEIGLINRHTIDDYDLKIM